MAQNSRAILYDSQEAIEDKCISEEPALKIQFNEISQVCKFCDRNYKQMNQKYVKLHAEVCLKMNETGISRDDLEQVLKTYYPETDRYQNQGSPRQKSKGNAVFINQMWQMIQEQPLVIKFFLKCALAWVCLFMEYLVCSGFMIGYESRHQEDYAVQEQKEFRQAISKTPLIWNIDIAEKIAYGNKTPTKDEKSSEGFGISPVKKLRRTSDRMIQEVQDRIKSDRQALVVGRRKTDDDDEYESETSSIQEYEHSLGNLDSSVVEMIDEMKKSGVKSLRHRCCVNDSSQVSEASFLKHSFSRRTMYVLPRSLTRLTKMINKESEHAKQQKRQQKKATLPKPKPSPVATDVFDSTGNILNATPKALNKEYRREQQQIPHKQRFGRLCGTSGIAQFRTNLKNRKVIVVTNKSFNSNNSIGSMQTQPANDEPLRVQSWKPSSIADKNNAGKTDDEKFQDELQKIPFKCSVISNNPIDLKIKEMHSQMAIRVPIAHVSDRQYLIGDKIKTLQLKGDFVSIGYEQLQNYLSEKNQSLMIKQLQNQMAAHNLDLKAVVEMLIQQKKKIRTSTK